MDHRIIEHLLHSYGRSRSIWLGIALTATAQLIAKVIIPIALAKWVADSIFSNSVSKGDFAWIVALYIASFVVGVLGDYIFVKRSDELYEKLVGRFYDMAVAQRVDFFREEKSGSLAALFRNMLDGTINLFRLVRVDLIPLAIAIIGPLVVLGRHSILAALFFAFGVLARGCVSWLSIIRIKPLRRRAIAAYDELSGAVGDQLSHLPVVRASGNHSRNKARITSLAAIEGGLFWLRHKESAKLELLANGVAAISFIGVLAVLLSLNSADTIKLELSVLAVILVFQGLHAAQGAGELQQRLSERWEHVATSLQKLPSGLKGSTNKSQGKKAPNSGEIELHNVSFAYNHADSRLIFDAVNLKILDGWHVAVVGGNGAGKSTFINLIMRFDQAQAGELFYSGQIIDEWDPELFYRSISYVPQEPKLFNDTVLNNILFYEPQASSERLSAVKDLLHLDRLERELPGGFEAQAGEMGSQLSGGQRQLVALARALLRDARVYVFDEATSALAQELGAEIVRNIRKYLHDRTIVFVTHSPEIAGMFGTRLEIGEGGIDLSGRDDGRQYSLKLQQLKLEKK